MLTQWRSQKKMQGATWSASPHIQEDELRRAKAAAAAAATMMEAERRELQEEADATAGEAKAREPERMPETAQGATAEVAVDEGENAQFENRGTEVLPEADKDENRAKEIVDTFLASNGFKDVRSKRRKLLRVSYPLHAAVQQNNAEVVALLLQRGADPTSKNSWGQTPLQLARKRCRKAHDTNQKVLSALTCTVNLA